MRRTANLCFPCGSGFRLKVPKVGKHTKVGTKRFRIAIHRYGIFLFLPATGSRIQESRNNADPDPKRIVLPRLFIRAMKRKGFFLVGT
jgi:hypothetical protein